MRFIRILAAQLRPQVFDVACLDDRGVILQPKHLDVLRGEGYRVEFHENPMEHEVCGEEIAEVERWLRKMLVGNAS